MNFALFASPQTPSVPLGHLPLTKGENERGFYMAWSEIRAELASAKPNSRHYHA